jgi:SulP family sulfate permease
MTSLAALLLLVAWNMSDLKHVLHTLRVAPKSDVAVLLTCFTLTVAFDMVVGVAVGMVLASFLFMGRMAEVTQARLMATGSQLDLAPAFGTSLPGEIPPGVAVYEISGPLFFGAAEKAMATLGVISERSKAVIFIMDQVPVIDVTGLVAFESALDSLRKQKRLAILSGVRPQPMGVLKRAGLDQREGVVLCADWAQALAAARNAQSLPSPATPAVTPV